jgi:hypothetical protein
MRERARWVHRILALSIGLLVAGLPGDAPAAGDEAPPSGLERLKGRSGDGTLPLGEGDPAPSKASEPPAGAKGLGQTPGQGSYTPGKAGGDKGSDPETIGGGTRVRKGSELDDIH